MAIPRAEYAIMCGNDKIDTWREYFFPHNPQQVLRAWGNARGCDTTGYYAVLVWEKKEYY